MKVLVAQLCLILCDHTGSSVHGILQGRTLEWVAMPSSRGSWDLPNPGIEAGSPAIGRQVLYH